MRGALAVINKLTTQVLSYGKGRSFGLVFVFLSFLGLAVFSLQALLGIANNSASSWTISPG